MLSMTPQSPIVMVASAINGRVPRKLDYAGGFWDGARARPPTPTRSSRGPPTHKGNYVVTLMLLAASLLVEYSPIRCRAAISC